MTESRVTPRGWLLLCVVDVIAVCFGFAVVAHYEKHWSPNARIAGVFVLLAAAALAACAYGQVWEALEARQRRL
jgi:hypothetical protein